MNDQPLAYLLTWTCHGTWLHGDQRGSVAPGHNAPGSEILSPNPQLERAERYRMTTPPVELTTAARHIVRGAIEKHTAMSRWPVHALNVRTNHVHMVVANPSPDGVPPERIMNSRKAWATRRLREEGLFPANQRIWTRHGSTRYLWDEPSVAAAVAYVEEGHDVPR